MNQALRISYLDCHYIPARKSQENRLPGDKLLIVMHGLGDSIEGYRFLPDFLQVPNIHYLLVNAPDAYYTGFSWFDIYNDIRPGIIRSRDLLFRSLDELTRNGWKSSDIALFGFSQGCVMAMDLACRYPEPFAAVVGISGFVAGMEEYPAKLSPVARKQRIFMSHGTEDPMLPIDVTRKQAELLRGMGLDIEWKEYLKDHTIDPVAEARDIRRFLAKSFASTLSQNT